MVLLCVAQAMVKLVPFRYWRGSLGQLAPVAGVLPGGCAGSARRLAVHVERGAARLPFATKCLPRAMALCWLLRRAGIGYVLKIAARPAAARHADLPGPADLPDPADLPGPADLPDYDDRLHAWVESANITVIGALAGPWLVVLALSG